MTEKDPKASEGQQKQRAKKLLQNTEQRLEEDPDNLQLKARRSELKNILCFVDAPDEDAYREAEERILEMESNSDSAGKHTQFARPKIDPPKP